MSLGSTSEVSKSFPKMKLFGFRFLFDSKVKPELALLGETSLSGFLEFDALFSSISKLQENLITSEIRSNTFFKFSTFGLRLK